MQIQRSFFDPQHDHGHWSPSTSSANFCEEDYTVSLYIAEFANTLSNLAYIYFALYPPQLGLKGSRNANHVSLKERVQSLDLQAICLILVGVTSGLFHASLRPLPQWLDESSMYLLAASWIYVLLTTSYIRHGRSKLTISRTNRVFVTVSLAACLVLSSFIVHATGNMDIHSTIFALLLIVSGVKMIYFIYVATSTPNLAPLGTRRILLGGLAKALFFLWLGFSLWLVDCNPATCHYLRSIRHSILEHSSLFRPLTFVVELHAWWHFFTACAAGYYISLVRFLTTETSGLQEGKGGTKGQ